MKSYATIDEYISNFPEDVQKILEQLRHAIHAAAPDALEAISYGIPTFKLNGNLVHFGGFKKHIGFFPGAEAIEIFADDLKNYHTSKGTIQFPLDQPLPMKLILKIVKYRVNSTKIKKK